MDVVRQLGSVGALIIEFYFTLLLQAKNCTCSFRDHLYIETACSDGMHIDIYLVLGRIGRRMKELQPFFLTKKSLSHVAVLGAGWVKSNERLVHYVWHV